MESKELMEAIFNQLFIARVELNTRFRRNFDLRNDPWWRKRLRDMVSNMRQNNAVIDALIDGRVVCK